MASELLFDLDSIDMSARQVDKAGIARLLPHRGDIALLDAIVWHDEACDHGVAIHHVRADAWWCSGHIPGMPIMPGVLMIEAGAQLASVLYYKRCARDWFAGFTHIDRTRFSGKVVPGDDLYILCRAVKFHERRFITDIQGVVNGEIVFDGNITGMAFPKMGSARVQAIHGSAGGAAEAAASRGARAQALRALE